MEIFFFGHKKLPENAERSFIPVRRYNVNLSARQPTIYKGSPRRVCIVLLSVH